MDQEGLTYSLFIGISSSLVATAIFILVSEMIRKIAIPWFSDKIYKGVRIDGHWDSLNGDAEFDLRQWGDKVTGRYSHTSHNGATTYKVTGILKNMYLMAITEPESEKIIDAASLLLHVEYSEDCLILRGGVLYKGDPGSIESWNGLEFKQKVS